MDGYREAEPQVHTRRVVADWFVDELVQFGEADDVVEAPSDVPGGEPEDRPVQVHVLPAGQLGVEPRAQFEQGRKAAVGHGRALVGPQDPGQNLQQGRLAGTVPADDAKRRARRHVEAHVAQRPELLVAGAVPG